jgi:hypothetical protein
METISNMPPQSETSGAKAEKISVSTDKNEAQKKLVGELKVQWKLLWSERFDDKPKAECISVNNYEQLRVERGDVIHATRDYKALNFKEILKQNSVENPDRFVQPPVHVGGWNKFIKTEITSSPNHQSPRSKRAATYAPEKPKGQTQKKGGRGWLHTT